MLNHLIYKPLPLQWPIANTNVGVAVQVVVLNVVTELFDHAGCQAVLMKDTAFHKRVVGFIRDEHVRVVKDVTLGRGSASFAHYSTLFVYKMLHFGKMDPQVVRSVQGGCRGVLGKVCLRAFDAAQPRPSLEPTLFQEPLHLPLPPTAPPLPLECLPTGLWHDKSSGKAMPLMPNAQRAARTLCWSASASQPLGISVLEH